MSTQNQNQVQKLVQTQAIESIPVTNPLEVSSPISAIAPQLNSPTAHSQQNTIACTSSPATPVEGNNPMLAIANDPLTLIIALTALARAGTPLIRATKTLIRTLRDRSTRK